MRRMLCNFVESWIVEIKTIHLMVAALTFFSIGIPSIVASVRQYTAMLAIAGKFGRALIVQMPSVLVLSLVVVGIFIVLDMVVLLAVTLIID